jgi:hypothetical protein
MLHEDLHTVVLKMNPRSIASFASDESHLIGPVSFPSFSAKP